MKPYVTHCALRLGDNLAHLHFIRHLALLHPEDRFVHYAHAPYLFQLKDVVRDLRNVVLMDLDTNGHGDYWRMVPNGGGSIDAWKNAGGFWINHPLKNYYAEFFIEFFHHLSARMGLESPFTKTEDLLFDYPCLHDPSDNATCAPFDFLVINSNPMSGQASGFLPVEMSSLIDELHSKKYSIITTAHSGVNCTCTAFTGMTVTQIGRLSQSCKYILMVSTGPSWPTFNVWNVDSVKKRVVIIDSEIIGLSKNTEQVRTVHQARLALVTAGIL